MRNDVKSELVATRIAAEEAERLRRLAQDVGRPLSDLLRFSLHQLRRETLPPAWVASAEIERAVR